MANAKTTFTNTINGFGLGVTKNGAGTLTLSGAQNYATLTTSTGTTNLNGALGSGSSTLNANAATNIGTSQTLAALNIGDGAVVTFAAPPPPGFAGENFALSPQAVPEPGIASVLLAGIATLLASRRRTRATA